jgi:integrase
MSDIDRYLEAAWGTSPPFWMGAILFLNTGGRIGEVLAMRRMDVDMERRVILFRRSKDYRTGTVKEYTKGKTDREIPVNDTLFAALKFWFGFDHEADPEDYIVRWTKAENRHSWKNRANRPFSSGHFAKLHRRILEAKNLPPVTPHGLRHTYATHNLGRDPNLDVYRIQKLLGHQDISTTMRYLHLVKDRLAKKKNLFAVGGKTLDKIRSEVPMRGKLKVVK